MTARKGAALGLGLLGLALGLGMGAWETRRRADPEPPTAALPSDARLVESRSSAADLGLLTQLGYVEGTLDPEGGAGGVLHYEPGRAAEGLSFYTSRSVPGARLIDMQGRLVHRWEGQGSGWAHAELLADGRVLVIQKDERVFQVDAGGRELWSLPLRAHHDLWVDPEDGEIFVLTRRVASRPELHPRAELLVDFVTVLSPQGRQLREIDLLDALRSSEFAWLLPDLLGYPAGEVALDVLHTNHVEGIPPGRAHGFYHASDLLLSFRNLNAIALLDTTARRVRWVWGPNNVTFQHHPTLLESGRILLFDNGLERSRLLELDPRDGRIAWRYAPESGFFTRTRGSSQRLWNGNTLVTESDRGRVREIDPAGRVVWSFANPDVNERGERVAIWRMTRVPASQLRFLSGAVRAAAR